MHLFSHMQKAGFLMTKLKYERERRERGLDNHIVILELNA